MIISLNERFAIKQGFTDLCSATDAVCTQLHDDSHSFVWLDKRQETRLDIDDPIERLTYILRCYTLHPGQQPKTVLLAPGFVAATPKTYELFQQMTAARRSFQDKLVTLRKKLLGIKDSTLDNQFGNPSHERPAVIDDFLKEIGLDHLHFKHVYRCPPMLEAAPKQLAWTWAHTNSIKKISTTQARALLERRNKNGRLDADLEKLSLLPSDVSLSLRQSLAPHLRINITEPSGSRVMLKGSLPVVFPRSGTELPIIRACKELSLGESATEEKKVRKDKKASDKPFIAAIRAYLNHADQEAFDKKYGII
jgi:hypothetical protein